MKLNILVFLTATIIFTNFIPVFGESRILWEQSKSLTWSDFQGEQNKFPDEYDGDRKDKVAFTWGYMIQEPAKFEHVGSVICQYQITYAEIKAEFSSSESWHIPEKVVELNLEHEQGHFDIIEIHARQYEKELLFRVFPCLDGIYNESEIKKQINLTFQKYLEQARNQHYVYDNLTIQNNELIESKQKHETKQISRELQRYFIPDSYFSEKSLPEFTTMTHYDEKTCTMGWDVVEKLSNKKLNCVTPAVAEKLVERNWGRIIPYLGY